MSIQQANEAATRAGEYLREEVARRDELKASEAPAAQLREAEQRVADARLDLDAAEAFEQAVEDGGDRL
jgi:hypothetical protein